MDWLPTVWRICVVKITPNRTFSTFEHGLLDLSSAKTENHLPNGSKLHPSAPRGLVTARQQHLEIQGAGKTAAAVTVVNMIGLPFNGAIKWLKPPHAVFVPGTEVGLRTYVSS